MKIEHNITSSEYHKIKLNENGVKYCSKSSLKSFLEDANNFIFGPPFKVTQTMNLGSYLDAILLDPKELKHFYNKTENPHLNSNGHCRSDAAKAWRDSMAESGKIELSDAEKAVVNLNVKYLKAHPVAGQVVAQSDPQVAMFGELCGVPFKGLLDMVPKKDSRWGDWLFDLKRTSKFLPKNFKSHCYNMLYTGQAATYLDLWNEIQRATGGTDFRTRFGFVLSNSDSPYGAGVCEMPEEMIQHGRDWYKEGVQKWRWCHENKIFPTPYGEDINEIITL